MNPRETLDEAIDRVASRMTRGGDGGIEVGPVWVAPPPSRWIGWRTVGIAGASLAAVLLAVAIVRQPAVDDRDANASISAAPLTAWSPLRSPVLHLSAADAADTADRGVGAEGPRRAAAVREPNGFDEDIAPAFGIPFLEAPAALAVAPQTMAGIGVDAVAEIETIEVAPLLVDALDPGLDNDSKEP